MNLTKTLIEIIESKGLKHDSIEFSVKLQNSENIDDNIVVVGSVKINQLRDADKFNIPACETLQLEVIKELIKDIDEMEYFKLFQPSHYAWINSKEYAEYQENQKLISVHNYSVDQTIFFINENLPYTIQAISDNFAVCTRPLDEHEDADMLTKPFNRYAKSTKVYVIIDFNECRRGPDNMVFSMHDYKTKKSCRLALKELEAGEMSVSRRHGIDLDIDHDKTNIKE